MKTAKAEKAKSKREFLDACKKALKDAGSRVTRSRVAVIEALAESTVPLSARELFESISEDLGAATVDQVTVYRVLDTFLELGLVHQVFPSGGYLPCFHQSCGHAMHVLLRCAKCENIAELDIPPETLAPMIWYLKGEHGFQPDEHLFQVNGTCSVCRESA